ncbi:uncharacterized protein LOC113565384 [Drosophila persimilis]|uniref:uncharacterized protein LOC113565384 n=1 Tax=Drosophila persimilis TaxID=7234 RepID=UPI000F07464D|nr:uncharacterized protein LOC113565384 [Drosophila persimilis]
MILLDKQLTKWSHQYGGLRSDGGHCRHMQAMKAALAPSKGRTSTLAGICSKLQNSAKRKSPPYQTNFITKAEYRIITGKLGAHGRDATAFVNRLNFSDNRSEINGTLIYSRNLPEEVPSTSK